MTERALIIAVEEYPFATDGFTAKKLDGTLAAARRFRDWLLAKWRAEGAQGTIRFCSSPAEQGEGCSGASVAELIAALDALEAEGRDRTDTFYLYFSGHGFRLANSRSALADVLVAADFRSTKLSGATCFKLDALVDGLRSSLGPGTHFYFVDACRNEVASAIGFDIMPFAGRGSEEPSVFVLQSTTPGAPSLVGGPFVNRLLDGLHGQGTAKVWEPPAVDSMRVRFDSLRQYLKKQLHGHQAITQWTSGEKGEREAVLATIRPVPQVSLEVTVPGGVDATNATVQIGAFGEINATSRPLSVPTTAVVLRPNHYRVVVTVPDARVSPDFVDVELYADTTAAFDVRPLPLEAVPLVRGALDGPPTAFTIAVKVPPRLSVELSHLGSDKSLVLASSKRERLAPGSYSATLRSAEGRLIRRETVVVGHGGPPRIDLADWYGTLALESLAGQLIERDSGIDFAAELDGPVADPDPFIWLALIGGARILGIPGVKGRLAELPLASFDAMAAMASPLYVLASVPDARTRLRVALGGEKDSPPDWQSAIEPPGLPGVRELILAPPAGQVFVSLSIDDQPTLTVSSFLLPNRCTLMVVTQDNEGQIRIGQYLLPLAHLRELLPPDMRAILAGRNQLLDLYRTSQLGRAFQRRRRLAEAIGLADLQEVLHCKWAEPIGATLAAYECARRGVLRDSLGEAAANLASFFPEMPDSAAVLRLATARSTGLPNGIPLVLDGLRAFANPDRREGGGATYQVELPYPAPLLDFTGPWTTWRGAVTPPDPDA